MASQQYPRLKTDVYLANYKLKYLAQLISCICLFACETQNDDDYNPCLSPFRLETIWPAAVGFDWIPYLPGQAYTFKHSNTDSMVFQISTYKESQDFLQSIFLIRCPQDTAQQKPIEYTLKSYFSTLKNINPLHPLSYIQINLASLLDEQNSTYDQILLADIISINSGLKIHGDVPLFQFPVLDRGFIPQNNIRFLYQDSLYLDQKLLRSVYYNDENTFQIQIFYTTLGIEAIRFNNKLYFRNF